MTEAHIRLREHEQEELSFYSTGTTDIEYTFPFGWGELWGIADRTNYDLSCHAKVSGESFEYTDPFTGEKFVPYCVEPSLGADRVALAFLCDAYDEEELDKGDVRVVLHLHPAMEIPVSPCQGLLSPITDIPVISHAAILIRLHPMQDVPPHLPKYF